MSRQHNKISACFLLVFMVAGWMQFVSSQNADEMGNGDITEVAPSLLLKNGLIDQKFRWPRATIPFQFEGNYPRYLRRMFYRATRHISARTCLRFVRRTSQKDYVVITQGNGCYSEVGRIGGPQIMSLSQICSRQFGNFVHELLHATGLLHEQSRSDRDKFVRIIWENIKEGAEENFESHSTSVVSPFGVPYDYGSVMHYSRKALSKNNKDTIVPIEAGVEIGQRVGMSQGDAIKVNNMYCLGN